MPRYNGGFIGTDGLDAPDAPSIDSVTAGNQSVSVAFTAGTAGTTATTGFVATTDTGGGNTGSSSPITISSLTNDTAVTVRVYAINAHGTSEPSAASSSATPSNPRALFFGGDGFSPNSDFTNIIDYINVFTTGNATDFGDLGSAKRELAGCSSSTRGIMMGGNATPDGQSNIIEYVTMSSTGNASDFGD